MHALFDKLTMLAVALAVGTICGPLVVRFCMRRRPVYCPGQQRCLWIRVMLDWWFPPRLCGYNLSGLPASGGGPVCPECGRVVGSRQGRRSPHRGRLRRWAAIALIVVAGALNGGYVRSGQWVQHLPTTGLILIERLPYEQRPQRLRRELEARMAGGTVALSGFQERLLISTLIADLRCDGARWNAHRALELLPRLSSAAPALHAALGSPDWQQRQLAAHLLRGWPGMAPTEELLRITVEGLRDDHLPYQRFPNSRRYTTTWVANAREGILYLSVHLDRAAPLVAEGLESDDWQQRFLCAAILGYGGGIEYVAAAAPILIPELADDGRAENARTAAGALYGFGEAVIPHLCRLRQSSDDQQRSLVRSILGDLEDAAAGRPRTGSSWQRHPGILTAQDIRVPGWW
jgi:hypothetical protein